MTMTLNVDQQIRMAFAQKTKSKKKLIFTIQRQINNCSLKTSRGYITKPGNLKNNAVSWGRLGCGNQNEKESRIELTFSCSGRWSMISLRRAWVGLHEQRTTSSKSRLSCSSRPFASRPTRITPFKSRSIFLQHQWPPPTNISLASRNILDL